MKAEPERLHYFQYGGELRITVFREGFVKAFAAKTCLSGNPSSGDVPECGGNQRRVSLCNYCIKINSASSSVLR